MTRRKRPKATPPVCPYCGKPAVFTPTSSEVYHGRDYGPLWICRPCLAWVGCHKGTRQPLGRLADAELRKAKLAAHAVFDPLWKSGRMTRKEAYRRLAKAMGLAEPPHMGEMDLNMCQRVTGAVNDIDADMEAEGDPDDCPFDS